VTAGPILAIDQGTTNTKALLIDGSGRIAASASRAVSIRYPQPEWVEQDAWELWTSVVETAGECLGRAGGVTPAAIGISNQRESVVVWDRLTGEPAGPCVAWQCRRTAPFCAALRERGAECLVRQRTGLALDPLFSASKAHWLLEHIPDGLRRAADGELCIGTVDSWVLWNLTGRAAHATDLTNASRTQLLNLRRLDWDQELLELFSIPRAALPAVHPSSHIFGATVEHGAIPAGVPIGALAGDSHAALFGHGVFGPGAVKATYGTGSSLMTITEEPAASAEGLSTTIAWSRAGETRYALEGNIPVTGGAVQWLGDLLRLPSPAEDVARLALTVADSAGVYVVPAFAGLGAPYWNDAARGLISGLTQGTTAAHLARAIIESIAYQVCDVFAAMERDTARTLPALLAGGGASRNDLLMQFQADILERPVVRSGGAGVSAMGAAWLAGLAVGVWRSMEELGSLPRVEDRFHPKMAAGERARRHDGWREATERTMGRLQHHAGKG
jgi:glycerol kinase